MRAIGQRVVSEGHENGSVDRHQESKGRKKEEREEGRGPGREEGPDKSTLPYCGEPVPTIFL